MLIRLQKHIADLGICSRRKAEELISLGKIKVNGEIITKLGTKVDPHEDKVDVLKNKLSLRGGVPTTVGTTTSQSRKQRDSYVALRAPRNDRLYIVLNKPPGYITSTTSKQGRSVLNLLTKENCADKIKHEIKQRVYPVGRLDKDSEGLVLLTNDGGLTNLLTHPRYEHEKEYEAIIDKPLTEAGKKQLEKGMDIGEVVRGIKIKKVTGKKLALILKEGKNRQIRKMLGRLGYNVVSLKRIRIGKLELGKLSKGKWQTVDKQDILC